MYESDAVSALVLSGIVLGCVIAIVRAVSWIFSSPKPTPPSSARVTMAQPLASALIAGDTHTVDTLIANMSADELMAIAKLKKIREQKNVPGAQSVWGF